MIRAEQEAEDVTRANQRISRGTEEEPAQLAERETDVTRANREIARGEEGERASGIRRDAATLNPPD